MFTKRIIKNLFVLLLVVLVALGSIEAVYAARLNDVDSTGKIAYDYKLSCSIWPWSSIGGYTNSSFILTTAQYNTSYSGSSYIKIVADSDSSQYVTKQVSISPGTNYAETGTITLKGYRSGCTSTHRSTLVLEGKTYSHSSVLKE